MRQGKFYTSAGVTVGIDLSLALIEEDFGEVALAVARELVVYLKRPGGQEQYFEPLKFQGQSSSRFADLARHICRAIFRSNGWRNGCVSARDNSHGASDRSSGVRPRRLSSACGWMKRANDCRRREAPSKPSPARWVSWIPTAFAAPS
jgi:hypothetical protein